MLKLIIHVEIYRGSLTQTFKYINYPCSGTLLNKISPIVSVVSTFKLSLQENACLSKKGPKTDQIFSQMVSCIFKVFQRIRGSFQQQKLLEPCFVSFVNQAEIISFLSFFIMMLFSTFGSFKITKPIPCINKRCLHGSRNSHNISLKRYLMNRSAPFSVTFLV